MATTRCRGIPLPRDHRGWLSQTVGVVDFRHDASHILCLDSDDRDFAFFALLDSSALHRSADHGEDDHGDVTAFDARCLETRHLRHLLAVLVARVVRARGELAILVQTELAGPVLRVHHDQAGGGGKDAVCVRGHRALAGQLTERTENTHWKAEFTSIRGGSLRRIHPASAGNCACDLER